MNLRKTTKTERIIFFSVMTLMVISLIWAILNVFTAPLEYSDDVFLIKNDYILMTTEAIGAIVVLLIPTFLEKKMKFDIPSKMHIFVVVFLFAAVFLGEFSRFHFLVPYWDKMLHIISAAFLASLGFSIIQTFTKYDIIYLNPIFVAIFSFSFAMAIGGLWEVYEFFWDYHFNLNMLKYMDEFGNAYSGLDAVIDTVTDLMIDAIGAFSMSVIGFFAVKLDKPWIHDFMIYKQNKEKGDNHAL